MSSEEDVERLFARAIAEYGTIDIPVNDAGQPRATGTVLTYDLDYRTIRAGDDTAVAITADRRS